MIIKILKQTEWKGTAAAAQLLTYRSTCLVGYIDQLAIVREDISAKSGNEAPMLQMLELVKNSLPMFCLSSDSPVWYHRVTMGNQ